MTSSAMSGCTTSYWMELRTQEWWRLSQFSIFLTSYKMNPLHVIFGLYYIIRSAMLQDLQCFWATFISLSDPMHFINNAFSGMRMSHRWGDTVSVKDCFLVDDEEHATLLLWCKTCCCDQQSWVWWQWKRVIMTWWCLSIFGTSCQKWCQVHKWW
jgi:hypothetical protein